MRSVIAAAGAIALLGSHGPAVAEDHEAGAPLTPAEAAGAWTVESGGRNVCILQLTATRTGQG